MDAAPQAITQTQYAFKIAPQPAFSHIVVFILPGTQFPVDTAATVYVQIPPSQEFKLLGGIGPGKESAIFRVSGLKSGVLADGNVDSDVDAMTDDSSASAAGATAMATGDIVLGVSIEPAAQVNAQLANVNQRSSSLAKLNSTSGSKVTTKLLAQRIIGNAFNFLASFGSDTVPLKAFQDWWTKFEKKVELDPTFLERAEQG